MQFSVVAYPNITSEEFSVQLTVNTSDMVSFMVYDTQGKLVDSGILNSETKLYIGAQYQPGLYLLVAVLNNEKRILRLVKQ